MGGGWNNRPGSIWRRQKAERAKPRLIYAVIGLWAAYAGLRAILTLLQVH